MSWLDDVAALAHAQLVALDPTHPARAYLTSRGVTEAEIRTYHLGYFVPAGQLVSCTEEFWAWFQRYGYDRLVFPMTDAFGACVGLQVRHVEEKGYENFTLKPRELYLPCFGLHVALPAMFQSQRAVLVEGIFDYFAAVKVAPDALSVLTANVSLGHKRLLARYVTMVIALFDMDATGRRGAYRLAGLEVPAEFRRPEDVSGRMTPVPPYQVIIPSYSEHDPNNLLCAGKIAELRQLALPQVLNRTPVWTNTSPP